MKRISRSLSLLVCLILLSSCSWVTSRRSLFGDEAQEEGSSQAVATVPKSQFDALAQKYEALLKERQSSGVQEKAIEKISPNEANQMMNQMEGDPSLLVDKLNKVKSTSELAETVDVFQSQPAAQQRSFKPMSTGTINSGLIEDHIAKVRKAEGLVNQRKYDNAITLIKELERSPVKQVVVRAKYLMGEILFSQGEYDLSLQIFEEILERHAFSGLVIKTLGRLIVCSEKLKLVGKQEKYYSILHDFFEQGA